MSASRKKKPVVPTPMQKADFDFARRLTRSVQWIEQEQKAEKAAGR